MLRGVIGDDATIRALRAQASRLLATARLPPVLILGETGSGKTLLARELHAASARAEAPFVSINCAAIPESLLESELFGIERGAFTDARESKPGLLQTAHRGVLFLDEIGHLPLRLQPKLLTVLEEWKVRRVGGTRAEPVDVWLVAATSEDLERAIAEQRFLRALFHRLAVVTFRIPPLRERAGDVPAIAEQILENVCRTYRVPKKRLSADAVALLGRHSWPGNVRELGNVIERAALLADGAEIGAALLGLEPAVAETPGVGRYRRKSEDERSELERALGEANGNVSEAARLLGLPRNTLRYRLKRHGLVAEGAPAKEPPPPVRSGDPPRWEMQSVAFLGAALEDARDEGWLDVLDEKIELFGGRVLERDQTRLLALFGLGAVEDGARRAALAGLTAVQASGTTPRMAIAVEVGEVEVARLEGEIILGADATTRARELGEARPASGIWLGRAAAQAVRRHFRVTTVDDRAFIDAEQPASPGTPSSALVGRAGEVLLLAARAHTAAAGSGQIVGIAGPAGIGKSRLLAQLRAQLADRFAVVEAHCAAHSSGFAFHPIVALVRSLLEIVDGDGAQPELLHLLGADAASDGLTTLAPEKLRARTFAAVRALLLRAAAARPLLVLVEDLHWADASSRDCLDFLVEGMGRAPLLLLVSYRPESEPAFMARPLATRIALAPLSRDESRDLVAALLPAERAELLDGIVARGEGNPLFLEELALAVRGGAVLDAIPDGLHGILRLRMERIGPSERRLLQVASVLGREFSRAQLASLWDGGDPPDPLVDALDAADLLYAAGDRLRFKHALTRDAAYETLVDADRARLHERAARALEIAHRERPAEACELIAHHYARSHNREKAVDFLTLAQATTYRRFALDQATAYFDEAMARLANLPETPANLRRRLTLLLNHCDAIGYLARVDEYRAHLEAATATAGKLGDPALWARVRARRGCLCWWTGNLEKAIEELEPSIRFAPDSPDEEYNSGVWLVHAYRGVGRYAPLFAIVPRLLEKLAARGSIIHRAYVHGARVAALAECGRLAEALDDGHALLRYGESTRDVVVTSYGSWMLARLLAIRGDLPRAIELVDRAVASVFTPLDALYSRLVRGWIYARAGRGAELRDETAAATAQARRSGVVIALELLALPDVELSLGRWDEARAALDEHFETATSTGMHAIAAAARRRQGELALRTGDLTTARARLDEAFAKLDEMGAAYERALALAALGELALREGSDGRGQIAEAAAALEAMGALPDAARIRQLLAQ